MRILLTAVVAVSIALFASGCKKSEQKPEVKQAARPAAVPQAIAAPESLARIHWLGKKHVAADTNAAYLMSIWNLPESGRLEAQTLDKLATAPWRFAGKLATNYQTLVTNHHVLVTGPVLSLRPLIEDLLQEECYLEIRQATNQPAETVLAVRLSEARAALWQTNLATAVESLAGRRPEPAPGGAAGWFLTFHDRRSGATNQMLFVRARDWTLCSLSQGRSGLLGDLVASIGIRGVPYGPHPDNWLQAELDLPGLAKTLELGWSLPDNFPRVSLAVNGDGQDVRTRGQLKFAKALPGELAPWNIPTNLVHEPLIGFTAVRNIETLLGSLKIWTDLGLGSVPNQFFGWSQQGLPFLTFFAAPMPDASNTVVNLAERLATAGNSWALSNSIGRFTSARDANGVTWDGLALIAPVLKSSVETGGGFLCGSLLSVALTNRPPPADLLAQITGPTNLVGYDWEITSLRTHAWIDIAQLARLLFNRAQIPFEGATLAWFKAAEPKLRTTATALTKLDAKQIGLVRRSSVGFNSIELQLLADWLESPNFPRGLHTFKAPPPQRMGSRSRTNAIAQPK